MAKNTNSILTEEFLYELFFMAFKSPLIVSIVSAHVKSKYLPDKAFQSLHAEIAKHYKAYKDCPSYGAMMQKFSTNDDVVALIAEVRDSGYSGTTDSLVDELEEYIKSVKSAQMYEEFGALYQKNNKEKAQELMIDHAEWLKSFTLKGEEFTEVISTFEARHLENKIKQQEEKVSGRPSVSKFYIDDLDVLNRGRDLRGQVACFLASTGVGKSHIARHVGKCAALEGLNILHFQLEGSKEEVMDAYSASLIEENSISFERANLSEAQMKAIKVELSQISGTIRVRAYPRFNNHVSTIDISNGIKEYIKATNKRPDIVLVDSMDLLTDSSGKSWSPSDERHKRVAVVNDLKDIAGEEKCFMVTTTQSNINDQAWINDPKNVLDEYNCAESKGVSRALTWLISLNQTVDERKEGIMRIHIAKSRFTKKSDTYKIATDFDREIFYDRKRTLELKRIQDAMK